MLEILPWLADEPIPDAFVFGPDRSTNVPHRIKDHSPTGLSWGYMGSGPHDTALNILALFLPEESARALYRRFCRDVISQIEFRSQEPTVLPRDSVERWIMDHLDPETLGEPVDEPSEKRPAVDALEDHAEKLERLFEVSREVREAMQQMTSAVRRAHESIERAKTLIEEIDDAPE